MIQLPLLSLESCLKSTVRILQKTFESQIPEYKYFIYFYTRPFRRYFLLTSSFSTTGFFKYQNPTVKPTNYCQLKNLSAFFIELQRNLLIQSFTDSEYRGLVTIPEVKFEKSKQNSWIVKVWIAEELFYYDHPFLLPIFSKQRITKDQFEVIQVFSSINLQKIIFTREFLDSYSAVLSNQRTTKIKKLFLQFGGFLKEHDLIESNYKIISDEYYYPVQKLNIHNN
jgi:hypothetical protein